MIIDNGACSSAGAVFVFGVWAGNPEYVKSTVNRFDYCTIYVFLPESTYFVQ